MELSSGGGFRAAAFGLGALRALHDLGVLSDVHVVSGISGGSLLAGMWAYGPTDFAAFDDSVTELLHRGPQAGIVRRTFAPRRAVLSVISLAAALTPGRQPRRSTRTEALVDALATHSFGARNVTEVSHPGLSTVLSATDLSTGNAVRFGSVVSSCSPLGVITDPVTVAEAVAASAAFPVLLPALARTFTFQRLDGTRQTRTVLMTDGGVYDNLGLTPLLPGRSSQFTSHAYDLDYVVVVDAGTGRSATRPPNFMLGRLKRSFEIAHARNQDGTRARIHELTASRQLKGLIYTYLGQRDDRLPIPIVGMVPREPIVAYPTNFAKMPPADLRAITTRAEQLTRSLIEYYCPELGN